MEPATDMSKKACMYQRAHGLAQHGRVLADSLQHDPQGAMTQGLPLFGRVLPVVLC